MKKARRFLAAVIFTLCLSFTAAASENINLPSFDVTLNGIKVDSQTRQFPLIVYKDITYFPITYFDTRFLGVRSSWDAESNTLDIYRENICGAYRDYESDTINPVYDSAEICTFNVYVNGLQIYNNEEEYPLLLYRDVTYFPLTWRFAVEEFGWEYSFDENAGLIINSDTTKITRLEFENFGGYGTVATDGDYYYYTGNAGNIYRTPVSDLSANEIIHTMPDNAPYGTSWVQFSESGDNLFFTYHIGGATMGRTYRYKINPDGTVEESTEGSYTHSGIGYNCTTLDGDGFRVDIYNSGHIGTSEIYCTKDGSDEQIHLALDGIRLCEYRDLSMMLPEDVDNGEWLGSNEDGNIWFGNPVCLGKVLYVTGWDENVEADSALYRIDLASGEITKILDSITHFHAYYGWDNEISGMTEFIIYDKDSVRYRYSRATGKSLEIDRDVLPMKYAVGDTELAIIGSDGIFSSVYVYDCYGYGSISGERFSITAQADFTKIGDYLTGVIYDGTESSIIFVNGPYGFVNLCETPIDFDHVFTHENKLIFVVNDPEIMVLELEI